MILSRKRLKNRIPPNRSQRTQLLYYWNFISYLIRYHVYLYWFFNFPIIFLSFLCRRFNVKLKNSSYIGIFHVSTQIGHCCIPFSISSCYRETMPIAIYTSKTHSFVLYKQASVLLCFNSVQSNIYRVYIRRI